MTSVNQEIFITRINIIREYLEIIKIESVLLEEQFKKIINSKASEL